MNERSVIVGLSSRPTDHVLRVGRRTYFLRCGVDLLLNAGMGPAEGTTRCPTCGALVRLRLSPGKVDSTHPAGAVGFVTEVRGTRNRLEVCCPDSAIFDSADCLRRWAGARGSPKGIGGTVAALARSLGRLRCSDGG